jgi:hypothetical protein
MDKPAQTLQAEQPNGEVLVTTDDSMTWWSELSDLDRLNVLNNPMEDRARILSSKVSLSIEETMKENVRSCRHSIGGKL